MAKAVVSSFEAVTRLTKVPTLVGGLLGKRMAVGRVSLRACNKTLTGCEPLLFVASFEWRDSTYSARPPLDSQFSARRRAVVAHLVTRKRRPRRFRHSYRKATMGSTRVARDAGR
jgi:hypothetical protein